MLTGTLYQRRAGVEARLRELLSLADELLVARCTVPLPDHPDYVPTECLLHLVRTQSGQAPRAVRQLFSLLIERVMRQLPAREQLDARGISLTGSNIADAALDRFLELLQTDRHGYDERLDYYEVSFAGALATLRSDARKKIWREEKHCVPIVPDADTGELPANMEAAVGWAEAFGAAQLERAEFRGRLAAAIRKLPLLQQRILEMLRFDYPIAANDPGVMTIAKALGTGEKTIRRQRNQAFATLREFLTGDKSP